MKLTLFQKLWLLGAFAIFSYPILDIYGFVEMKPLLLLAMLCPLMLTWSIMPSMKELGKQHRNG